MPTARPFKYAGSVNYANGSFAGAGFDGIPVVFPATIDVSGYDRVEPLTGEQACQIYWNLAGWDIDADASVPPLSVTFPGEGGDPPVTLTNETGTISASADGDLFLEDNDSTLYGPIDMGYQPDERMLAYPKGNSYSESESVGISDEDPLQAHVNAQAAVSSPGLTLKKMYQGGMFLGYGFSNLLYMRTIANAGIYQVTEKTKNIISYLEDIPEDTGSVEYSVKTITVGGADFIELTMEKFINADETNWISKGYAQEPNADPIFFRY